MANVAGQGSSWDVFGLEGELYVVNQRTPFLNAIGGLNGGRNVGNIIFSTGVNSALETASQQALTEANAASDASTASTEITYTGSNLMNHIQLMRRDATLTALAQSAMGRVQGAEVSTSGYAYVDRLASAANLAELDQQIALALSQIALDFDYSAIQGTAVASTGKTVAAKMRGMLEVCDESDSTDVDASGGALTDALVYSLLAGVASSGGEFRQPVLVGNSFQIKKLHDIFGYAPPDRSVGGVQLSTIFTQFGPIGVMWEPQMPADDLLLADMAFIQPVFLPYEGQRISVIPTAKVGAADAAMVYTQASIDHGPSRMHGKINTLATS